MGWLHSVELENFKSYAGHQVIGPFSRMSCVVGPNGAGKSNLMEAISFAVGIHARQLRSDKLQNVIFHGAGGSRPKRALVTLVYRFDEGEQTQEGETELSFSRSITAGGRSSYQIGRRGVSYEAYVEKLGTIGVMVEARNFLIFQGDVESIAQMSPQDLSRMIDDVSGARGLAAAFDELKERKDQADRATVLAFQKRKGYVAEKRQVREQKEEAERFEEIQRDVAGLKTTAYLHRLLHAERETEETETARQELLAEKAEVVEGLAALKQAAQKTKKAQAKAQRDADALERKRDRMRGEVKEHAPRAIRITERLKKLRKSVKNYDAALKRIARDAAAKEERVAQLFEEKARLEQESESLLDDLEGLGTSDLGLTASQQEEFAELQRQARSVCVSERQRIETLERQRLAEVEHLREVEAELEALSRRSKIAAEDTARSEARVEELHEVATQADAELGRLRDEIAGQETRARDDATTVDDVEARLHAVKEKLKTRRDVRRQGRKAQKMTECIETLIGLFPGVYGRLIDICKPTQRKYHKAVAVAGGKVMDHIVVDTTKTGVACIEYMRQQRVGTASFIPLDTIRTEGVRERLRSLGPDYQLCCDVIDCEDDVRKAVMYAVGNTVISRDLAAARQLCFDRGMNVRSVTLSGHMISRSGAMTGGAARGGDGRGDRWDEQEFAALRKERDELEERIRQLSNRRLHAQALQHLRSQLAAATRRKASADQDGARLTTRLEQGRHQLDKAKAARAVKDESLRGYQAARDAKEAEIARLREVVEVEENKLYASFSSGADLAQLRATGERSRREKHALEEEREAKKEKLVQIEADIEYEQSRNLEKPLEKVRGQRREATELLGSLEAELGEVEASKQTTSAALEKLGQEWETLRARLQEEHIAGDARRQDCADLLQRSKTLERKILSCDSDAERLAAKHAEILREAEVDQVRVPLHDEAEAESAESAADVQRRVDFRGLKGDKYRDPARFQQLQAALQKDISTKLGLAEQLQPNLRAIQRFDDVSERLKHTTDEFEEAKEAARAVSEEFDDVRRRRLDAFMECFNHIVEALGRTYKDLTKSSKHPLGGNAYLMLENVDEPYLGGVKYNAMPPMKRFRDMEQLSGGEKTVAALGLLFAIHSFRPAPFFVMDEIDAALDNVNVKKVCNFVCQRREDFQSVIITHKDQFYRQADVLCGIARDDDAGHSIAYTLNLREFPE